jgi:hypothetical protein
MSDEWSQHFSHRNGNGLVTSKKTSRYQKIRHSISPPERCFKNRRWSGKDRAQSEFLTSMKYISIAVRLDGRALLIPAGCHAAADRATANHLVRIGWLRLLTEMKIQSQRLQEILMRN